MFGTGLSFSVFLGTLLCACSVASVVAETEEAATFGSITVGGSGIRP